ncbi:MAG: heme o synthase [Chloroflexi bacterium]|nr:heme o synthase [Chloroflexota bacterium]
MPNLARHFFSLAKPRIVLLLVVTAAAGAWKAAAGSPEPAVLLAVVLAGAVAAAGANVINQGLEADIDARMRRTRERAVASRRVGPTAAVIAGVVLVAIAVVALAITTNLLAGLLTLAAAAVYVLVYTVLLKRRSWNNIVIGGAAGAFPPLIGAAAVSGHIDAVGLYMFAFVFFWTPPHFWTLSLVLRDDYAAAKIPMLGAVASPRDTAVQIMLYILLLTALAWLPLAAGYGGLAFALAATLLGAYWLRASWPLRHGAGAKQALSAYKFSLVYLALVFLVLAVEPMLPWYA